MRAFFTKTRGCCGKWVDYMRSSGFKVIVNEVSSTAEYRQKYGVPEKLQSCHTAAVDGYSIEEHVPAAKIRRLLNEKPRASKERRRLVTMLSRYRADERAPQ